MSLRQKRPHLACYDIADPRRLTRIHQYLCRIGIPLQYSVFLLYINPEEKECIVTDLEQRIDPHKDDVRIYPLPRQPEWQWWGKPLWLDGVQLAGIPLPNGFQGTTVLSEEDNAVKDE